MRIASILGQLIAKQRKKENNLQHYTFGGMTNIKKTPLFTQLRSNKFKPSSDHNFSSDLGFDSGREKLTGFSTSNTNKDENYTKLLRPTRPKVPNFFDQAYGSDIKKKARERPMS